MFEDATFHSNGVASTYTSRWMLPALGINLALLAALILQPLIHPDGLPDRLLSRLLYAPIPPAAASRKTPAARVTPQPMQHISNPSVTTRLTPSEPRTGSEGPASYEDMATASGGNEVAGATAATSVFPSALPVVVVTPSPKRPVISGGVAGGLLLSHPAPLYPAIAKIARVSGTVVLAATISKTGSIASLRVLSGNPMLCDSALDAVRTWTYRPYLLDGEPVAVETTINVVFTLGGR